MIVASDHFVEHEPNDSIRDGVDTGELAPMDQKNCREGWWCQGTAASLCFQGILLGGRLKQRRKPKICLHRSTITTVTAGLAREVCESCARVTLRYVETAVQVRPDIEPSLAELDEVKSFEASITFEKMSSSRTRCRLCAQSAAFLVPDGLMCAEHAWQAAARVDWDESDPWIPIRIQIGRSLT